MVQEFHASLSLSIDGLRKFDTEMINRIMCCLQKSGTQTLVAECCGMFLIQLRKENFNNVVSRNSSINVSTKLAGSFDFVSSAKTTNVCH